MILKKQQQQQHFNNSMYHQHQHHNNSKNNRLVKNHHELVTTGLDSSHTPTKFSADNSAISSVVTSPTSSVRSKRTHLTSSTGQPQEEPKRNNGHQRVVSTESLDPLHTSKSNCKQTAAEIIIFSVTFNHLLKMMNA